MTKQFILLIIPLAFFFLVALKAMAQEENLSVLSGWRKWQDAPNMLYNHLSEQAFDYLAEREAKIATLKTEALWIRRQEEVRQTLMAIVGPLPEKTPLNPKVVGVIDKEGYRVEKITYESMPNLFVTACLFIPDHLQGKTPAILNPIGHSQAAFRRPLYQQVILNLVKKGFIVLTYDPVGQGERLQYFDPEKGESRIGGPTSEHSYVGAQCFISGRSLARYWVWDGIRAMDYLLTRSEVDPQRIGITGLSGGGTATAYIAAFDDRIWAAAPAGYITSFRRLLESIGPQDAEQNFYHGIASDIDHADLLEIRAPKPALLIATTRDYFSIQGARETYQEVKTAYKAKGVEDNFDMVEDDDTHGYTRKNREATYAFFQKHLHLPGSSTDEELELLSPEELQVTDTGQISTSLGGETVFSINRTEAQNLWQNLEESRKKLTRHLQAVKGMAKELSGYVHPNRTPQAVFTGRYQREGYSIEKYMLEGEEEYVIPLLLMLPDEGEKHPAIIYIHPDGKTAEASEGGQMEWFVKQGFAVLSADLIGTGETGSGKSAAYTEWFESILIARSIVGIQAGDIVRIVKYLESREDIDYNNISAIAFKEMCPVLLHGAAFCESINKIALVEPLISYRSMVMNRYYNPRFIPAAVAGALTAYDLPDLAAGLAPRNLLMVNITDQNGDRAEADLTEKDLSVVRSAYSSANAKEKWEIKSWEDDQKLEEIFYSWLPVSKEKQKTTENLQVLSSESSSMLHSYLMQQASKQFEARREAVAKALNTPDGIAQRQEQLRQDYLHILGDFPEKTPLNAMVTGTIQCDDYRIEKVVYESRPNHHVTANLYLPTSGEEPYPGVLVLCGHSSNGKAIEAYQKACILLAKSGFVALIVDPICQGERYQFLDASGKPATRGGTTTHTLLDVGAKLVGTGVVAYEAWDNIRGIDYLISRPEVDADRIGCTGNSGGGTQTAFLIPLDERIKVAAPSCYIMTMERKFATLGPADGCQHLPSEGAFGIEHADYLTMFAPKPAIVLAAEEDYFDINATSEAFRETKRVYKTLGFADQVDMFASDETHGYSKSQRETMVWWMRRWLLNDTSPVIEPELIIQKDEDLWATETGQVVSNCEDEVTVADLNLKRAKELASERNSFWQEHDKAECLSEVKRLIGLRDRQQKPTVEYTDTIQRNGYRIEKLIINREGEVPVPGLLFSPNKREGKLSATLYVNGCGKDRDAAMGGSIAELVSTGRIVLAIDERGFGETADVPERNAGKYWNDEHRNAYIAMHLGRPLLGQRVEDVLAALDVLVQRRDVESKAISLIGIGRAGPVTLHASALDARFADVTIQHSLESWLDVVAAPLAHNQLTHVVPFALTRYDLPHLVQAISPRTVQILNPVDAYGKPKKSEE